MEGHGHGNHHGLPVDWDIQPFPMMTVPLETLLAMTRLQPFEELLDSGALVEFATKGSKITKGKAMFVSHQWANSTHPDPEMMQLAVLQRALQKLISGQSQVGFVENLEPPQPPQPPQSSDVSPMSPGNGIEMALNRSPRTPDQCCDTLL